MQFIDFCYNKAYGHNSEELFSLREKLESLFAEYALKLDHSASPSTCKKKDKVGIHFAEYALKLDHSASPSTCKKKDKGKAPLGMEVDDSYLLKLELYLDELIMKWSYQLDILSYWKTNQCRYPILTAMAHDILCIPISTIASEAAFSVGGRVLDQFRSSLKHDIVKAIVCIRDWLYGK
ncbi:zinc finger BED domain-containing protein RICESLEEPER 4-like [Morus notabilis]|uniref:zinc finger BED domain-containing protein RICESLEEPER 4-like n=1 Tax=Morus notabilis TaxID=981085 RepID=UPI000CECE6B1|nr:zinc finger BED domain-containing protein RICESLEEPER 4-like [Morus notabilis]